MTFICLNISKYYEENAKNHNYLFLSAMVAKLEKAQSPIPNGVARTMKKLCTSKGDYWNKQWFSSIASLYKLGHSLKGKKLASKGSEFLPSIAAPYGMKNHLPHYVTYIDRVLCLLRMCVAAQWELRQCSIPHTQDQHGPEPNTQFEQHQTME